MGVALSGIVAAMMLAFTRFGMFSWVDAKAIIHITVTVPMTPFAGWIVPSLSLSTLVNAGVIALIVPLVLLFWNLFRKKKRRFG
jgi:preflagellin peptidase FlaK